MDNKELKKKIEYILAEYNFETDNGWILDTEEMADALIAAEIGDVREWKRRAEVAERALKICLIDNLHCYECDMGFDGKCKETDKEKEKCAMLEIDDYIQQAEKELAELNGGKK